MEARIDIYTTVYEVHNSKDLLSAEELYSVLCNDLYRKRLNKIEYMYI